MRYIPGGVPPPPRKAKATMNCRAPVACLVKVSVSCLATVAVPGGEPPQDPPLAHAPWCWVTDFVSCLDTTAVPANPPAPPRRARPLVLGHRFIYLFLKMLIKWRTIKSLVHKKFDFTVDEGKERLNPSRDKNKDMHRKRKMDEKFCVTFLLCDPGWYIRRT